ncbi:probable starch synthase 4, chloroplastic/amyloplastic isoform X5 [Hevea brasiliensis]|uniref:probable starch synthase 4, chloroplastic/amyloplastic isoform X5 n=1 Tax=Hevea brasiliensis TaxID=3981 RepID=UPI0025D8C19E|nr:probable starch synthase 4, chloroplastic/amyloplastic isoform X5 [Hevea brasiliensis]
MEISINAAILCPLPFPKSNTARWKPFKAPSLRFRFLRKNGDANGLFRAHSKLEVEDHDNAEMPQENFKESDFESEVKHNHIWQLFKEAQQNILYLNNQRLLAVEELNRANQEKQLLLDRIEQLEAEKRAGVGKDKQSLCCELLLRIDSMVLTGMINTAEASNLRKAVMDYKISVADISLDNVQKSDAELLSELRHFSYGSKKSGFHIIHICTEMAPVVEVGSLASYVTGLSCALLRAGHLVEVILPKYACLNLSEIQGLREIEAESYSYFDGQLHGNKIWTGVVNGIGVTFIQPLYYSSFFNREKVYGYSDDFERFSYFSRASLDYITKSGKQPDVLHIHNWETAIVGPLFWDIFVKQGLGDTRILLTCHGFDSQCLEQPDKLALCGLDPSRLHRPDRLQDNAKTHLVNILKVGCIFSELSDFEVDNLKAVVWNATRNSVQVLTSIRIMYFHCFIFMGSKMPSANRALESLQKALQGENMRFMNKYDEALSHLIIAGSDIILCQSFHDPLLQMPLKALKYGAAPIAVASNENRFRPVADHDQEATKFSQFISSTFGNMSLSEALNEIKYNPSKWKQSMVTSMAMDFSWDAECCDIHVSAYTVLKSL